MCAGLLTAALLFISASVLAQTDTAQAGSAQAGTPPIVPTLTQNRAYRSGTEIIIEYRLDLGTLIKSCEISVYLSTNGGSTFSPNPMNSIVKGDVGKITTSGEKKIVWDFDRYKTIYSGQDLSFKVVVEKVDLVRQKRVKQEKVAQATPKPEPAKKVKQETPKQESKKEVKQETPKEEPKPKVEQPQKREQSATPKPKKEKSPVKGSFLVMANLGVYPQLSYGLMAGWTKRVGPYVKFRSDFSSPSTTYECKSDGTTGGGNIWTTGNVAKSRMTVTAGAMFRTVKWLYPYVGVGYGSRTLVWEDIDGNWAKVTDNSFTGVSIDAGLIFRFGKVSFSLGANNTQFKYTEFEAGIGIMF